MAQPVRNRRYAGSRLQPAGNIHRTAHNREFQAVCAPGAPCHHGSEAQADTHRDRGPLRGTFHIPGGDDAAHRVRASQGPGRVIDARLRRAEYRRYLVADEVIQSALVIENRLGHAVVKITQERDSRPVAMSP